MDVYPGRLIFVHMPKTAGQAVNAWLAGALGTGVVSDNSTGMHRDLIGRLGGLYSVISGHVAFHPGEKLDPRYRYVTVLREPVDRALSWIYYLLKNVPDHPSTLALKEGAAEFVATRGAKANDVFANSLRDPYLSTLSPIGRNPLDKEDLIEATLATLRSFDVVGCYERMPRFLAALGSLLHIVEPASLPIVNETLARPEISDADPTMVDRIRALTARDREVYRRVIEDLDRFCPERPEAEQFEPPSSGWRRLDRVASPVYSTGDITVLGAEIKPLPTVQQGAVVEVRIDIRVNRPMAELDVGLHVTDSDGRLLLGTATSKQGVPVRHVECGEYRISHHLTANLPWGSHPIGIAVAEVDGSERRQLIRLEGLVTLQIQALAANRSVGLSPCPVFTLVHRLSVPSEPQVASSVFSGQTAHAQYA
jgi:hypothetical protein